MHHLGAQSTQWTELNAMNALHNPKHTYSATGSRAGIHDRSALNQLIQTAFAKTRNFFWKCSCWDQSEAMRQILCWLQKNKTTTTKCLEIVRSDSLFSHKLLIVPNWKCFENQQLKLCYCSTGHKSHGTYNI